jgi:hypothetical protein
MRQRKTADEWRFWVNYGQGWEHETTELTFREAREQSRTYATNCPEYPRKITGPHRVPLNQEIVPCNTL